MPFPGVIHNPKAYVRDFYFFKRSQYPQLSLIHVDPEEAYNAMQNNVFYLKLLEIGKTLKSLAMLMRPDQVSSGTQEARGGGYPPTFMKYNICPVVLHG